MPAAVKHNARELAARMAALRERAETGAAALVADNAAGMADLARSAVPVDSGELRGSISSSADGCVTASAPHAAMVEYGTSRMAAQPFMLPSARAQAGIFFKGAREVIK